MPQSRGIGNIWAGSVLYSHTYRCYVCVSLLAVSVTQREVAPDAQVSWSQVKGHIEGGAFLLDFNMFRVPVYIQTETEFHEV